MGAVRTSRGYRVVCFVIALLSAVAPSTGDAQTIAAGFTPGSFRVNESGAANYTIPIQVPPGTAGLEPKLALTYNSKGGNGLLGMGWGLSGLSAIARCPRTVVQDTVKSGIKYDSNDRFCLDGQRLVLVAAASYGADQAGYRTERETFTKVISNGQVPAPGSGPQWFQVWTKSGQIMEYGRTEDSRIEAQGKTTVRLWALNKISDRKGNYLTITYVEDNPNGDFYPQKIEYTGNTGAGTPPYASVQFTYPSLNRPDIAPAYVGGSVVKTTKRLTNIKTYAGTTLVRDYQLAYDNASSTARSRLTSLTECDGSTVCLAPTTFEGQKDVDANGIFTYWTRTTSSASIGGTNSFRHYFADVNGDGKADMIQVANHFDQGWIGLSNGDGTFQHWTSDSPNIGRVSAYAHYFADVNGDGKADLIQVSSGPNLGWVALSNGTGFNYWTPSSPTPNAGATSSYTHYFVDVNGDGCADWIQVANTIDHGWIGLSNCDGTFNYWTSDSASIGNNNGYAHYFADVNGDGCTDWIQVAGAFNMDWVGLSNCDGTFNFWTSSSANAGATNASPDRYTHYFADVNGDGRADWIQVQNNSNRGWVGLSKGDGTFDYWTSSSDFVGATGAYSHHFADVNGDGRADWIQIKRSVNSGWVGLSKGDGTFDYWTSFSTDVGATDGFTHYFVDVDGDGLADWIQVVHDTSIGYVGLAKGPVPDFLTRVTYGLGPVTSISYKPLTDNSVYAKHGDSVYPIIDLKLPLYVASSASTSDGIGGSNVTTYFYEGLKAHQQGGGLLGFALVSSVDAQGIATRKSFRQDYPFQGLPLLVAKAQNNAAAWSINQISNTWTVSLTPNSTGKYHRCDLTQSVERGFDLNGAELPFVTTRSTYDTFGNASGITVTASDGFARSTANDYFNDSTNWLLGLLRRSQVTSTAP